MELSYCKIHVWSVIDQYIGHQLFSYTSANKEDLLASSKPQYFTQSPK